MTQVSVCIPTHNSAKFIRETVASVLAQRFEDFELVVSDDSSEDGTPDVIEQLSDSRIRVVRNAQRLGLVENWNRCLQLASGEYVSVFNHDDLMRPDHLARSAAALAAQPNAGFVFCNVETVDAAGCVVSGHWSPDELPSGDTVWRGMEFFQLMLRAGNLVPGSSVVMRRPLAQGSGGFDPRLYYTLDFEMWLRLALHADVGYIAAPLVQLRRHAGQVTSGFASQGGDVEQVWQALQIVFTEQRRYIHEPDAMFRVGLNHLVWWSRRQSWWAVRQNRIHAAGRYAMLFARFAYMRRRGLASLSPMTG